MSSLSRMHHSTPAHMHTQGRKGGVVEVLKSVRFPNMSRDYLLHIVETEEIIKDNSECLQMVSKPLCVSLIHSFKCYIRFGQRYQ